MYQELLDRFLSQYRLQNFSSKAQYLALSAAIKAHFPEYENNKVNSFV